MPRPLYPQERPGIHCIGGWVYRRAGLDWCRKSRPHQDSIPDRPGRSKSLYGLSYPSPHWSPGISSIFLSVLLGILATIFTVCAMRLIMRWSLHFVAFAFFFKANIVTSVKSSATLQFYVCCRSVVSLFWDRLLLTVGVYKSTRMHHGVLWLIGYKRNVSTTMFITPL